MWLNSCAREKLFKGPKMLKIMVKMRGKIVFLGLVDSYFKVSFNVPYFLIFFLELLNVLG